MHSEYILGMMTNTFNRLLKNKAEEMHTSVIRLILFSCHVLRSKVITIGQGLRYWTCLLLGVYANRLSGCIINGTGTVGFKLLNKHAKSNQINLHACATHSTVHREKDGSVPYMQIYVNYSNHSYLFYTCRPWDTSWSGSVGNGDVCHGWRHMLYYPNR